MVAKALFEAEHAVIVDIVKLDSEALASWLTFAIPLCETDISCTPDSFPHFVPILTKLILLVIFSLQEIEYLDRWVR